MWVVDGGGFAACASIQALYVGCTRGYSPTTGESPPPAYHTHIHITHTYTHITHTHTHSGKTVTVMAAPTNVTWYLFRTDIAVPLLDGAAKFAAAALDFYTSYLGVDLPLTKLDLVTREEFDVQSAVLARTRAKLEHLEAQVAELEKALKLGGASGRGSTAP